jgi:hypothetical protein
MKHRKAEKHRKKSDPNVFFWDCEALDERDALVYFGMNGLRVVVERTPIRMAERIVWTHNAILAKRHGLPNTKLFRTLLFGRCHPPMGQQRGCR